MQSYKCPKCEHETSTTRTGNGKNGPWTAYVCERGCVSDKTDKFGKPFKFMFFIDKKYWANMQGSKQDTVEHKQKTLGDVNNDLARIARALERLADKFCPPKKVNLSADPLEQAHNQEIDLNV